MPVSRVLLTEFRLRAYRSCRSASLSPDARTTALIGLNGSGKTNILQGLMLICASPRRAYRRDDDDVFTLKSEMSATYTVGKKQILLRASIVYRPTDQNRDEVLQSEEKWNFRALTGEDEWQELNTYRESRYTSPYTVVSHHRGNNRALIRLPLQTHLEFPSYPAARKLPKSAWRALEAIQEFRLNTAYYSASQFTNPTLCPPSFEIDEDGDLYSQSPAAPRRQDHLQFIYRLYRMSTSQESLYSTYISLVDDRGLA
jgi:predicted ATP-dependent endonuclease of OLD family